MNYHNFYNDLDERADDKDGDFPLGGKYAIADIKKWVEEHGKPDFKELCYVLVKNGNDQDAGRVHKECPLMIMLCCAKFEALNYLLEQGILCKVDQEMKKKIIFTLTHECEDFEAPEPADVYDWLYKNLFTFD